MAGTGGAAVGQPLGSQCGQPLALADADGQASSGTMQQWRRLESTEPGLLLYLHLSQFSLKTLTSYQASP